MPGQPAGYWCGIATGQHVDRPAGLQVDEQRGICVALEQGEVVDAQDPDEPRLGKRGLLSNLSRVSFATVMPSLRASRAPARPARA
ncbi:hypothetical protein [Streptomyces sp. NPDC048560]|uniref:hypothetical protein n=1 Tax=Streptomyces sp. NPDC048560 TaxID=3155488 RepID=UPI00342EF0E5